MPTIHEKRIKEGFPKQRLVVLPPTVVERCRSMPIVSNLYVTDIGCLRLRRPSLRRTTARHSGRRADLLPQRSRLNRNRQYHSKNSSRAIRNHPTQHPAYLPGGSERPMVDLLDTFHRSAHSGALGQSQTHRAKSHSSTCPIPASCATPSKTCTPA